MPNKVKMRQVHVPESPFLALFLSRIARERFVCAYSKFKLVFWLIARMYEEKRRIRKQKGSDGGRFGCAVSKKNIIFPEFDRVLFHVWLTAWSNFILQFRLFLRRNKFYERYANSWSAAEFWSIQKHWRLCGIFAVYENNLFSQSFLYSCN